MGRNLNKIILSLLVLLFAACEDVRYHTYQSLDSHWSVSDTLKYSYANNSIRDSIFELYVELRCTSSYPSRKLWLGVQYAVDSVVNSVTDTICCEIFDTLGQMNGPTAGTLYQLSFPAGICVVSPQDTLHMNIIHLMGEPVTGITDVGVKVCGRAPHPLSEIRTAE